LQLALAIPSQAGEGQTPKPPSPPDDQPPDGSSLPKPPNAARETVDQTIRLLEHFHQEKERQAAELESRGVTVIYGEDGRPISDVEAGERHRKALDRAETKTQNKRMAVWVLLLLVAGYFLLRQQVRASAR
jgi:hypothetical protein